MRAEAEETALIGIRGDGKTIAVLAAILAHAEVHRDNGFGLPVPWMAVRDSFSNHKVTTMESLTKPLWRGKWRLYDNNHLAAFQQGAGRDDLAVLKLAGCDNMDSINKLRQEVVGVWVQEAAPVEESGGVSETAYGIMNSSKGRVPTYHSPTLLDLNYPDEDHWVWNRFVTDPQPGTRAFKIPPRENKHVDPSYWVKMEATLQSRPDLRRRLLEGQPGSIQRGFQVAVGFNEDHHVAKGPLQIFKGEPLVIGQDGGLTPATIIGQVINGWFRVFAALTIDRGGMRQHLERNVVPWLTMNAPWALRTANLIFGVYDPAMPDDESDSDRNPVKVLQEILGGYWMPGPVSWEARKGALITALNRKVDLAHYALQIDAAHGRPLIRALSGGWYYPQNRLGGVSKDAPAKPNHPHEDLGDALCYWICGAEPQLRLQTLRNLGITGRLDHEYNPYDVRD